MKKPAKKTATKKRRVVPVLGNHQNSPSMASSYREIADLALLDFVTDYGRQRMASQQAHEIKTCDLHAEGAAYASLEALDVIAKERAAARVERMEAARRGFRRGFEAAKDTAPEPKAAP